MSQPKNKTCACFLTSPSRVTRTPVLVYILIFHLSLEKSHTLKYIHLLSKFPPRHMISQIPGVMFFVTSHPPTHTFSLVSLSLHLNLALSAGLISWDDWWKGPFFPHSHRDTRKYWVNERVMISNHLPEDSTCIGASLFLLRAPKWTAYRCTSSYLLGGDRGYTFDSACCRGGNRNILCGRADPVLLGVSTGDFQHQTVAMGLIRLERAGVKWTMAYFDGFKAVSYYNGESQGCSINPILGRRKERRSTKCI